MTKTGSTSTIALLAAATNHDADELAAAARAVLPRNRLNAAVIKVAAAAVALAAQRNGTTNPTPAGVLVDSMPETGETNLGGRPERTSPDDIIPDATRALSEEIESITAILEASSTPTSAAAALAPELARLERERDALQAGPSPSSPQPETSVTKLRADVTELKRSMATLLDTVTQAIAGGKRKPPPEMEVMDIDGAIDPLLRRKRERIAGMMLDPVGAISFPRPNIQI